MSVLARFSNEDERTVSRVATSLFLEFIVAPDQASERAQIDGSEKSIDKEWASHKVLVVG